MSALAVRYPDRQSLREKEKAIEDAKQTQLMVVEAAKRANKDPPKYVLLQLIGRGSFGRVYKAKDLISAKLVAVKIIDLDESDTINPRQADAYSDFIKEVNALKTLSESKTRNINNFIEALPVGKTMWMITDYCAGGSISTVMKPTLPGGLKEKWVIPILREVAEAIKWVHQAGIVHRDIKCANVLISEEGGIQLCDFGVAGTLETKMDKRTTMVGTPHWMAPELFDESPSYGKEVDIWAYGAMAYELATGLPPNVLKGISHENLGQHLKKNVPRLEGGSFSTGLRNIVAYCMEERPEDRPTIEEIQKHSYIFNTSSMYPASSLAELVKAYRRWEDHGGSRKSLFMKGGAQPPTELATTALSDDCWNFSTTAAFDDNISSDNDLSDVINVYGAAIYLNTDFSEETTKPIHRGREKGRRRPPPEALAPLRAPLEKIFDPNTISNYEDNSRVHYGRRMPQPSSDLPLRDLPLRDDSNQSSVRESRIDLGGHDIGTGLSSFPELETIKASRQPESDDYLSDALPDFHRPPRSDPENKNNRRTQDWKFPSMSTPMSADPEMSRFPDRIGQDSRPSLMHSQTEPVQSLNLMVSEPNSPNRMSLIDLDLGLAELPRPNTATSDVGSSTSENLNMGNPFDLERHASLYRPESMINLDDAEPNMYAANSGSAIPASITYDFTARPQTSNPGSDYGSLQPSLTMSMTSDRSDLSSDLDPPSGSDNYTYATDTDNDSLPKIRTQMQKLGNQGLPPLMQQLENQGLPPLPGPPSERAMMGTADRAEMLIEFERMFEGLEGQLAAFKDVYEGLVGVKRRSNGRSSGGGS